MSPVEERRLEVLGTEKTLQVITAIKLQEEMAADRAEMILRKAQNEEQLSMVKAVLNPAEVLRVRTRMRPAVRDRMVLADQRDHVQIQIIIMDMEDAEETGIMAEAAELLYLAAMLLDMVEAAEADISMRRI